jgi:hypothetical protein
MVDEGIWAMTIPLEQAAINLAVALGLSAVIGFERQWRNRLAGLRTNTLVALGAARGFRWGPLFLMWHNRDSGRFLTVDRDDGAPRRQAFSDFPLLESPELPAGREERADQRNATSSATSLK